MLTAWNIYVQISKGFGPSGFPTRAGNRAGSDPITSPIKALKKLPALEKKLPALQKFQGW